ncbi:sensor domain-containing diguanylate cyclase [Lichenihabitans sp. PAMC28606]|uniref:sensor domain-containing diguanylate cyclase n=1 Tax=Lichenihabitans sp. PAMC28606 TaxID=2880932 RepID=UPI001D0A9E72|nr:sensor domain-containing diguanylate cyclase [Lichenihabitans sp. PAMC28606]UDL93672.1 sensor domain-containing diguanylate cyclase [Lichenihabitans sp. PAMC28606]
MDDDLERDRTELLQFLYACPVGLIRADATGAITMLNPVAMQLLLGLGSVAQSMNLFAAIEGYAPELRHVVSDFEAEQGQICQGHRVFVGRSKGGKTDIPQVLACTIVKLGKDQLIVTLEDISERVAQERRLKQADAWFSSLLNAKDDFAILGLDLDGRIQTADAAVLLQTGFDERDLVGAHISILDRPDPASSSMSMTDEIAVAHRDGWHLAESWSALRDGGRYRCHRLISVRGDDSGAGQQVVGYTAVLRPVAQSRMDADKIRRRLTTDHLTGVCNRAHFFDIAEEELRRCSRSGRPVGLISLDIDYFKLVNDTHGHGVGDQVLKLVASACAAVLRPIDTLARLGGEEFTAMLPGADAVLTSTIAETMRSAIASASIKVGGTDLHVTASFGWVVGSAATGSLADLVQQADRALYTAKRSGRDRVVEGRPASPVA